MDRYPRRSRAGRTQCALLSEKFGNQADARETAAPKSHAVPCRRHEDHGDLGFIPCVLSSSLQAAFTENAILRVISKLQPRLCFFVRAYPENFSSSVRGISILRPLAEKAKINDKEVELVEVKDNAELNLASATMVLHSRYLSKRDIWSMHLTMAMQDRGQLLYANFDYNMRQHIPNSRIEQLTAGPERTPVACGLVTRGTEVTFKSSTANMCVLIQVSAELFEFGLAGRPYYDILLECFSHLLEKSLRVYGSDGSGHYLRMILFARISRRATDRERSTQGRAGHEFDEDEAPPVDRNSSAKSLNPLPEHEDYYDIFWEGFARAMPPAQQLIARVRQVFMYLHEPRPCRCDWRGIAARDIVEASRGNLLECLNVVLDFYDNHHLDRMLKVVGQPVVILTAGNGIIHASSEKLYELTHRRFITAGPSSCCLLCVREPPLHSTPCVYWPDGRPRSNLPSSPHWLQVYYYPEVSFCACPPQTERVGSSFFHLERLSNHLDSCFVPSWSRDAENLEETVRSVKVTSRAAASAALFKRNVADAIPWESFRLVRLRVAAAVTVMNIATPFADLSYQRYQQFSSRFPEKIGTAGMDNAELKNLMNDLVGLRLEVVTAAEVSMKESIDELRKGALHKASNDCSWKPDGSLMPLQTTIVKAANGTQWQLDPRESYLDISHIEQERKHLELKCYYNGFFVRRLLVTALEDSNLDQDWSQISRDSGARWVPSRRIFHLPSQLDWNMLDAIIAGSMRMPPAIPYPVDRSGADSNDRSDDGCWGWQLRSSVKQHFYALIPREESERSHAAHFAETLKRLGGRIACGVDPFRDEHGTSFDIDRYNDTRREMMQRFEALKTELDDLISGKATILSEKRRSELQLDVKMDITDRTLEIKSEGTTVYVKNVNIESSFPESRDWFELFYDNKYAPPKYFHIVMQWIVCSSVHMVNFKARFVKLVDKHGFQLVQLPIAQLFPQPSPDFLWTDDHETNFGRISLQPRRKIDLPRANSEKERLLRPRLYARLLEAWLHPPLNFAFLYFTPVGDSKANAHPTMEAKLRQTQGIYQRSRGWVLSDKDALCLVALRKDVIYWYENEIPLADARDFRTIDKRLHEIAEMRHVFYEVSYKIFDEVSKHENSPEDMNRSSGSPAQEPSPLDPLADQFTKEVAKEESESCSPVSRASGAPVLDDELEDLDFLI